VEDRWHQGDHILDPFRPGLRYPAVDDAEFDLLTAQHLRAVRTALEKATVFVFTLGLTEGWESSADGAVFPACPGTAGGEFDPIRHRFHNFTVSEMTDDLGYFVDSLTSVNPLVRIILTVSPVSLVATATNHHVLAATVYSKSALRVAAQEVADMHSSVTYFPAYEIVTGPQAPNEYFAEDLRDVSPAGVTAVMRALFARSEVPFPGGGHSASHRPTGQEMEEPSINAAQELSQRISTAECDEVLAEW
jgi:hypothetical protein